MAITPRTNINAANMATRWSQGVAGAGARWLGGIRSPRNLPNADPANNTANWLSGVSAAGPKFNKGISDPAYLTRLENGAQAKQGSYTGSGAAHQADFGSAASKIATAIDGALAQLPKKGPRGTNGGRSTSFGDYMHQRRGTLSKGQ
jgi:hypothetical protein